MKRLLALAALSAASFGASADAGVMFGVSYSFGGAASANNLGFTVKVLTSDREDKAVGSLGLSYFPWAARQLGADVGVGYNFENATAIVGYDFLQSSPQFSVGYTDTDSRSRPVVID